VSTTQQRTKPSFAFPYSPRIVATPRLPSVPVTTRSPRSLALPFALHHPSFRDRLPRQGVVVSRQGWDRRGTCDGTSGVLVLCSVVNLLVLVVAGDLVRRPAYLARKPYCSGNHYLLTDTVLPKWHGVKSLSPCDRGGSSNGAGYRRSPVLG
jgi:hypothetical protein